MTLNICLKNLLGFVKLVIILQSIQVVLMGKLCAAEKISRTFFCT